MIQRTRQGVRDLNPPGHTNPSRSPRPCTHFFGPQEVLETYTTPRGTYEAVGRRCLHCPEVTR